MAGHVSPKSTYYAIFGALMVLTAITVGVAFVPLGALNFPVAITIAITKATLVVLFFMHVMYSSRLTKMIVGMALFFLMTMFGLTLTDYLSRGWGSSPRGTAGAGSSVTIGPGGGRLAPSSQQGQPAAPAAPATQPEH
jgi:cytochrome c oxidase subunit 4